MRIVALLGLRTRRDLIGGQVDHDLTRRLKRSAPVSLLGLGVRCLEYPAFFFDLAADAKLDAGQANVSVAPCRRLDGRELRHIHDAPAGQVLALHGTDSPTKNPR